MSTFGGKADINHGLAGCPLIAISGHASMSTNVPGADTGGRVSKKPGPYPGPASFIVWLLARDEENSRP